MKKVCIIACSLLMAAALALGIVSSSSVNVPQEEVTLCDMEYGRVSF
jgi:hypothetical protein